MTYAWLVNPSRTNIAQSLLKSDWPPCPSAYSAADVRRTKRGENGDALLEVPKAFSTYRIYGQMGFVHLPPTLMLRSALLDRLNNAQSMLPAGLSFVILDGWRTRRFQQELAEHYMAISGSVLDDLFVSDPDDDLVAPPHVTGGAVDLTLEYAGQPLGLGTDFDAFENRSELDWFDRLDDDHLSEEERLCKRLRRCMAASLISCGFAHYPQEWWHWSFGDQWWAARNSVSTSLYSELDVITSGG